MRHQLYEHSFKRVLYIVKYMFKYFFQSIINLIQRRLKNKQLLLCMKADYYLQYVHEAKSESSQVQDTGVCDVVADK